MEVSGKGKIGIDQFGRQIIHSFDSSMINWDEYKTYLRQRFAIDHARSIFRYSKNLDKIIENPILLSQLNWRVAKYHLEALSVLKDFLKIKGYNFVFDATLLKKHMPKERIIPIFIYDEANKRILQDFKKASKKLGFKLKFVAAVFILTGLRGPELKYMFENWENLRSKQMYNTRIIELGYIRAKKNAWLTMMPVWAAEIQDHYKFVVGTKVVAHLNAKGFRPGLARKAHVEICSSHLSSAEVDLLQGRLQSIQVRHYIRFLGNIAKRYDLAFSPYYATIQQVLLGEI